MQPLTIIDYGAGNLASLRNAFEFLDISAEITSEVENIAAAEKIVLPGVGAFAPAIQRLRETGIAEQLQAHVKSGKDLLGICLGMQLLFETSEEQGTWQGLSMIPGTVKRFTTMKKVPHMGWNILEPVRDDGLFLGLPCPAFVYFVHSYYCVPDEKETVLAESEYGGRFTAVVRKDNVWGMQFHPEKSQDPGLQILKNFVEVS